MAKIDHQLSLKTTQYQETVQSKPAYCISQTRFQPTYIRLKTMFDQVMSQVLYLIQKCVCVWCVLNTNAANGCILNSRKSKSE